MFGEFFQKKVKEVDILNPRFKVPEKYYPEWYNRGLVPFEIDEERLRETMTDNNQKQRFPAAIIDDEDEAPKIKPATIMQNPKDTAWYDEMDAEIPSGKILDNNDIVDNEKLQKYEVKMSANDELVDIRAKLLEKQKPKKEAPTTAAPGEFVVMVKGKAAHKMESGHIDKCFADIGNSNGSGSGSGSGSKATV